MEPNWDRDTLLANRLNVKRRTLFPVIAGNRCEQTRLTKLRDGAETSRASVEFNNKVLRESNGAQVFTRAPHY